jgi:hypothetical protein
LPLEAGGRSSHDFIAVQRAVGDVSTAIGSD